MQNTLSHFIRVVVLVFTIFIVISIAWMLYLNLVENYGWADWTGIGDYIDSEGSFHRGKKLWDFFELLVIPVALALVAWYLNSQDRKAEREETRERVQEAAFQRYLDNMTELIVSHDLKGSQGRVGRLEDGAIQEVAQTRTVSVLRALDSPRRNSVFHFLRDSGLGEFLLVSASLQGINLSHTSIDSINLRNVDLRCSNQIEADLRGTDLKGANLFGADLSGANLAESNLSKANLRDAKFSRAILKSANLKETILSGADLSDVDLSNANMVSSDLYLANLKSANLSGVNLENSNLSGADLSGSILRGARLIGADLSLANLNRAKLRGLKLSRVFRWFSSVPDADLSDADLRDVKNLNHADISPDQLASAKNVPQ